MLNQLRENPEGFFFIAMVHQCSYYKVHSLHIAYSMVIVSECWEDPFQSVVGWIGYDVHVFVRGGVEVLHSIFRVAWINVFMEIKLRNVWESPHQIFFNILIETFQFVILITAFLNFPINFAHFFAIIMVIKQVLQQLVNLTACVGNIFKFVTFAGILVNLFITH